MTKSFEEIKSAFMPLNNQIKQERDVGTEAVRSIVNPELFKELSILDEHDKALVVKLIGIRSVFCKPSYLIKDAKERAVYKHLDTKLNNITEMFMLVCKSTDGRTQENIRDIYRSEMVYNENIVKQDHNIKLKR